MANENLTTIKTKIAAAAGITVQGADATKVANLTSALQTAQANEATAIAARTSAIAARDAAIAARDTAIAQRDAAIAALGDTTYYAALNAKNAEIAALTARIAALTASVIAAEHTSLENYKAHDITKATIATITPQTVTGSAITPTPAVTMGSTTLVKDTDYTLSYSNNTAVGTATVTVTGNGTYFFSKSANFAIAAIQSSGLTVAAIPDQTATGSAITPLPVVTYGQTTLVKDTDYTVAYADNTAVGTATITITGIGNYSGTKTVTFNIVAAGGGE